MDKTNKKAYVAIGLLSLALVSVISFSFAWFINNKDVSIQSKDNFSIEAGNSLYISMLKTNQDGSTYWTDYGNEIEMTTDKLIDVTGDGQTFYSPYTLTTSDQSVFPMFLIEEDEYEGYYVETRIKIRTNMTCGIYLANGSYVKPYGATDWDEADLTNLSMYGNFSANYIAGATRLAFLEDTVSNDVKTGELLKQIWIPNDKYQLTENDSGIPNGFIQNGTRESSYGYEINKFDDGSSTTGEIEYVPYEASDYYSRKVAVGNECLADVNNGLVNSTSSIVNFINNGSYQEKYITIRIWIEGTDREASAALNMGQVDFHVKFVAISKEEDSESDKTFVDNITAGESGVLYTDSSLGTAITSKDNVIYSYNGIDWADYEDKLPYYYESESLTNTTETVYVKLKETATMIRSKVKALDLTDIGGGD